MKAGELYVFCTDGIFEAFDNNGREFGVERLIKAVQRHRTGTAREIVDAIAEAVRQFRGPAPQSDDMTALVVRING
jgi:sigma-B regulation protein RsbU (phosphoserine phosphatase)